MNESPIALEEIASAVRPYLAAQPVHVERLPGLAGPSTNYRISLPARAYVLKVGTAREVTAEAWVCERLAREGIPVPEVVALDLESLPGKGFLLESLVEGRAVESRALGTRGELDDESRALLVRSGELIRTVHEITGTGFGRLAVVGVTEGRTPRGPFPTWRTAVERDLDELEPLVRMGVLPSRVAGRLRGAVRAYDRELARVTRSALLHGDLHPRHIFGADRAGRGVVTGLIDWGEAAYGDPAYDLGRFGRAGANALAALLRGYDPPKGSTFLAGLAFYGVLWSLRVVAATVARGRGEPRVHLEAIESGLAEFDRLEAEG